ncbi:MAG TPA: phage holin family protein [Burkholderiaceae bacterium]
MDASSARHGLPAAARAVLAGAIEMGQTRVQLACTELQEERLHLSRQLLRAVAALFFVCMGLVLASIWVVMLMWDEHRVLALGMLTAVHLGVGVALLLLIRRSAALRPPLLSATFEVLRGDAQALRSS